LTNGDFGVAEIAEKFGGKIEKQGVHEFRLPIHE
jgi:hypothetical protein